MKYEAPISIASLKEEVPVIVLDSTPDVLSIGRRCVEDGYRFVWGAHSDTPYLTTPSGKRINLVVHGYIPYLEPHDPISSDDEDNEEDAAPASLVNVALPDELIGADIETEFVMLDGTTAKYVDEGALCS